MGFEVRKENKTHGLNTGQEPCIKYRARVMEEP